MTFGEGRQRFEAVGICSLSSTSSPPIFGWISYCIFCCFFYFLLVFFFLLLTVCACLTLIKFPSYFSSHHCRQSRKPQIFPASKATEPTNPRLSSGFGAFSLYLSTLLSSQMHSQKQAGTFIASFNLSVCAFFLHIYTWKHWFMLPMPPSPFTLAAEHFGIFIPVESHVRLDREKRCSKRKTVKSAGD